LQPPRVYNVPIDYILEDAVQLSGYYRQLLYGWLGMVLIVVSGAVVGDDVEKTIFLVQEDNRVTAVNAETGQFFDLDISAKEVIKKHVVAKGVAVVVTNQRFAGVGVMPSGWSSTRRVAGEKLVSVEAEGTSAVIVTSGRVLSFNGKTGAWAEKRR
jgi:DNA-binding beta-propeller fold protein YncE